MTALLSCSCNCFNNIVSCSIMFEQMNKQTNTPVVRTGVIPTCRSPSLPAVANLSHGPSDCPASLSHLANDRPMHYRFFIFWPGGLTPGSKFTKRGEDLTDTEIYHPAKFHHSTWTHAGDIRYQNSADKQTVNDISPPCLSACTDNKLH